MFKLFPLVSEHTIKIINYFKNEKNKLSKSIENSWENRLCRGGGRLAGQSVIRNHNEVPHDNYNVAKKD